jgi:hypothetical protein
LTLLGLALAVGSAAGGEVRPFVSEAGGFSLEIPADWQVSEKPSDGSYRGLLKSGRAGGALRYDLTVLRLADYRETVRLPTDDPQEMARAYANSIGAMFPGDSNLVIELPSVKRGMELSFFRIEAGTGTENCMSFWLLHGIEGTQWFHALWEVPCSMRQELEPEINAMTVSLRVRRAWPGGASQ